VSLSADDKLAAVGSQKYEITIVDLATAMSRPFSFSGKKPREQQFVWFPDGKWLAFTAEVADNRWGIFRKATDGRTESKLVHLCQAGVCAASSWSHDGKLLALEEYDTLSEVHSEVVLSEDGKELFSLPHSGDPTFSPDGKWLAFQSDESGKSLAYVTAIPPGREKWQLSSDAAMVVLRSTSGTILYMAGGKIMELP